jgi:hypothetical protein
MAPRYVFEGWVYVAFRNPVVPWISGIAVRALD